MRRFLRTDVGLSYGGSMRWIDDHCHLHRDVAVADEQVAAGGAGGGGRLITVGCDLDQSAEYIDIARRHPGTVFATVGVHPHDAKDGLGGIEGLRGEAEG